MAKDDKKKRRGRPRSVAAASHDAILGAVYDLLHGKSVRDLTIEEVARQAGVGKPTIYKWWPSKAALVMAMLDERIVENVSAAGARNAEEAIRGLVTELVRRFNGFLGKVAVEILAEGQSEPGVLQEYRDRYLSKRRACASEVIERAQASGEFRKDIDPQVLIDMIFGPIYYRRLVRHQKLDERFGDELVHHVMAYVRSQPDRAGR
jgi:AcrR family transcriptional regulator